MQVNIGKYGLALCAVTITELDMLEINAAVRNALYGIFGGGDVRGLVEQLNDTLAGGTGHGEHDEDHREAHEAHENLRGVRQQAQKLAGGKTGRCVTAASNNGACAEPGEQEHRRVHAKLHQWSVPCELLLGFFEVLIDIFGNGGELLIFVIFTDKGLYHADAVQILLHNAVQFIISSEHALEDRVRSRHDEVQAENEHRDDGKEDKRELGVDAECRDKRENRHKRAAYRHADDHLVSVLQIRDVCCQTRDDTCGGKLIDV